MPCVAGTTLPPWQNKPVAPRDMWYLCINHVKSICLESTGSWEYFRKRGNDAGLCGCRSNGHELSACGAKRPASQTQVLAKLVGPILAVMGRFIG